jgi:hypothetical protein
MAGRPILDPPTTAHLKESRPRRTLRYAFSTFRRSCKYQADRGSFRALGNEAVTVHVILGGKGTLACGLGIAVGRISRRCGNRPIRAVYIHSGSRAAVALLRSTCARSCYQRRGANHRGTMLAVRVTRRYRGNGTRAPRARVIFIISYSISRTTSLPATPIVPTINLPASILVEPQIRISTIRN